MTHESHRNDTRGPLAVLLAATGFSWGFVIVKSMSLAPSWIAAFRLALGATFLTLLSLAFKRTWPRLSWPLAIAGLFFGAHQIIYIQATHTTSIAMVTVIGATKPLVVAILGTLLLKERSQAKVYVCALIALVGITLMATSGGGIGYRSLEGDIYATVNVLTMAGYFLAIKKCRTDNADTIPMTATVQWIALATVLGPALLSGTPQIESLDVLLLFVIVLGPANSHLLVNWALAKVHTAVAMLILGLVPVLASLWAFLILGEPLTALELVGMFIVIVSIYLAQRDG